jgi:hypothetical protein
MSQSAILLAPLAKPYNPAPNDAPAPTLATSPNRSPHPYPCLGY